MNHYESGWEELTLSQIQSFCRAYPSSRVIYMHSKGSFNNFAYQAPWRYHMMKAVTSEMCINPPDENCDVCGLLVLPFPSPHVTGNFFTARCNYVTKLFPVKKFTEAMETVIGKVLLERLVAGDLLSNLLTNEPHWLGTGRYANEHWILSHPSVEPCDVSLKTNITYWQNSFLDVSEFEWSMYPRSSIDAAFPYVDRKSLHLLLRGHDRKPFRVHEYYFLSGNLYRWYALYDMAPPESSWVWRWYPDGKEWASAVQKYGVNATDYMFQKYPATEGNELYSSP
jgi:hypothetical protein